MADQTIRSRAPLCELLRVGGAWNPNWDPIYERNPELVEKFISWGLSPILVADSGHRPQRHVVPVNQGQAQGGDRDARSSTAPDKRPKKMRRILLSSGLVVSLISARSTRTRTKLRFTH